MLNAFRCLQAIIFVAVSLSLMNPVIAKNRRKKVFCRDTIVTKKGKCIGCKIIDMYNKSITYKNRRGTRKIAMKNIDSECLKKLKEKYELKFRIKHEGLHVLILAICSKQNLAKLASFQQEYPKFFFLLAGFGAIIGLLLVFFGYYIHCLLARPSLFTPGLILGIVGLLFFSLLVDQLNFAVFTIPLLILLIIDLCIYLPFIIMKPQNGPAIDHRKGVFCFLSYSVFRLFIILFAAIPGTVFLICSIYLWLFVYIDNTANLQRLLLCSTLAALLISITGVISQILKMKHHKENSQKTN